MKIKSTHQQLHHWVEKQPRLTLLLFIVFSMLGAQLQASDHTFSHQTHESTEQCALYSPFDHGKACLATSHLLHTSPTTQIEQRVYVPARNNSVVAPYSSRAPPSYY